MVVRRQTLEGLFASGGGKLGNVFLSLNLSLLLLVGGMDEHMILRFYPF